MLKRARIGWLSYSQAGMPVSVSPKSTCLSTTASAVVALYVSKRALDPASSVEAWYISVWNPSFPILHFSLSCGADSPFPWLSLLFSFFLFYTPIFFLFFGIDSGLHKGGAGDSAARLQQKPETEKEAYGRWESKLVRIIKYSNLSNNNVCDCCAFIVVTDCGERDLPHQEAKMKAGLEKAVQHKDKLLEYDRNRYDKTRSHARRVTTIQ